MWDRDRLASGAGGKITRATLFSKNCGDGIKHGSLSNLNQTRCKICVPLHISIKYQWQRYQIRCVVNTYLGMHTFTSWKIRSTERNHTQCPDWRGVHWNFFGYTYFCSTLSLYKYVLFAIISSSGFLSTSLTKKQNFVFPGLLLTSYSKCYTY